jgi:hypothetical protein
MDNLVNYIYISTSIGFIINVTLLLITLGAVCDVFVTSLPIKYKTYFISSGLILLSMVILKIIFIHFIDKDDLINNACASYYCDHINLKFAYYLFIINAAVILIKLTMSSFSISNMIDSVGILTCIIVLALSCIIWWNFFHFSIPDTCKNMSQYELVNSFWSQ